MQNSNFDNERLLPNDEGSFVRPRLNAILTQAVKKPLTIVCAGMGCGKTRAVYDFSQSSGIPIVWVQLSESDNISFHVWENIVQALSKTDEKLAEEYKKLGFPSSDETFSRFMAIRQNGPKYVFVFDDFHYIKNPIVLDIFGKSVNNIPENRSIILISREYPNLNISSQLVRDNVSFINEEALNFTEGELYRFLIQKGLGSETNSLSKIYDDTKGWAFIIDFVTRMLEKRPGYSGYVQSAIKQDIFQLIESETWDNITQQLKDFFLRLSLTDHRSAELTKIIAGADVSLIPEMLDQNAFVRFDKHIDYYYVHSLFMDFLRTKQNELKPDEAYLTYRAIAEWCLDNDFVVDALLNYEKIADYDSIASVLYACSTRFLMDNVNDLLEIFDRMPEEVFDTVEVSAALHVQLVMNTGKILEAMRLLRYYEAKYLELPGDSDFKNRMLGNLYYQWSVLRMLQCTITDSYDFEYYSAKVNEYLEKLPVEQSGNWYQHPPGMWTNLAGSSREGALDDFMEALTRAMQVQETVTGYLGCGIEHLCKGELLYYQDNVAQAELCIKTAIENADKYGQYEIIWRALFYQLRISISKGEYAKIDRVLADMEYYLAVDDNPVRFLIHEMILGWYYQVLGQEEQIPIWLKDSFGSRVFYSNTLENYGNHIKAKYRFLTNEYQVLLEYIQQKKERQDIVLYERIEIMAMEACVFGKMNDNAAALSALEDTYALALPNGIVMPFVELGKDMRKLITQIAAEGKSKIPMEWINSIKSKVSTYSRRQARIIAEYRKISEADTKIVLTPRELEVLHDLNNRMSRAEIAAKYGLSVNTIKAHISSIYDKLNARNRADMYRIASEQNLI